MTRCHSLTLTLTLPMLLLLAVLPFPAAAHAPETHHLTVQAGPYPVEVGFSAWPLVAERSFDITFTPADGIEGKQATIDLAGPNGPERRISGTLGRHPRQRDVWGLDLISLSDPGPWTMDLAIEGPLGPGRATIGPIDVGLRPGPPPLPMYLIALIPFLAIVAAIVVAWRRVRPGSTPEATAWT